MEATVKPVEIEIPGLKPDQRRKEEEKRRKGGFFGPGARGLAGGRGAMSTWAGRGGLLGLRTLTDGDILTSVFAAMSRLFTLAGLRAALPYIAALLGAAAVVGLWLAGSSPSRVSQGAPAMGSSTPSLAPVRVGLGASESSGSLSILRESNGDFVKDGQILAKGAVELAKENEKHEAPEGAKVDDPTAAKTVAIEHRPSDVRDAVAAQVLSGDLSKLAPAFGGAAGAAGSDANPLHIGPSTFASANLNQGGPGKALKADAQGKASKFRNLPKLILAKIAARRTRNPGRAFYALQMMRARQYAAANAGNNAAAYSESSGPYDNAVTPKAGIVNLAGNGDYSINPLPDFGDQNGQENLPQFAQQQIAAQDFSKNGNNGNLSSAKGLWFAGLALIMAGMALMSNPFTAPIGAAMIAAGIMLLMAAMGQAGQGNQQGQQAQGKGSQLRNQGQNDAANIADMYGVADENRHPSNGTDLATAAQQSAAAQSQSILDAHKALDDSRMQANQARNGKYDPSKDNLTQTTTTGQVQGTTGK